MAESFVQLPPNSTGIEIRVIAGDATNLIPSGVTEEAVIPTDGVGLAAGDVRQRPMAVSEQTMQEVLLEMRRHTMMIAVAFGVDIPTAADADSITLMEEGASR